MAKTLANYDPLVQIPSGMTPAGADFPIVESHDILVGENDKRLDAKLDDIDSAIGNVGQTPIATQLSSKVNTSDIQTTVRDASSASDSKIPSEKAVRSAIDSKTINVDSTVTQGSTNAVSGGAVHTQLATKQDVLTFDTTPTASSSNPVTSGGVKSALDAKQDTLTFDTTPTVSSSNPVTSGGVKAALDTKQNTLTYETTPIAGSVNPVTSTGIRNAIDAAAAGNLGQMQAQYDEFVTDAEDVLEQAKSLSNGMVACSNITAETTVGDTRILLYTGTTNANYTNGHWYYNSAPSNAAPSWTDGGAVGSAPTIDNTLTVEGAAANSKAVGDAIENIVTISNTQPGSNSGNKVWIKETTSEEVQIPTYAEHIAKANKADIATNNESDNGSGTITASKKYAIGDHFYINNTNTSSENYGVSTLYKATAAIASGDAIVVGTNCEASKVADEITSLSNDIDTVKADLESITGSEIYEFTESGYYRLNTTTVDPNNIGTGAAYKHLSISCNEGDAFIITGQSSGAAARMYAFVDASYTVLSRASQSEALSDAVITAPASAAHLLVNDYQSTVKVIKGGNINSQIEKTGQQLQAVTKSLGVYINSFTSTGSVHSSLSDEFPVDIKEGESFNVTVAIDIDPSANSMQVFGIKEDSTYDVLVTGRFNTEYTITASDDIKRIGIAIGAQDTAYICTVTIETEQSSPFIAEKVTNIENTLDAVYYSDDFTMQNATTYYYPVYLKADREYLIRSAIGNTGAFTVTSSNDKSTILEDFGSISGGGSILKFTPAEDATYLRVYSNAAGQSFTFTDLDTYISKIEAEVTELTYDLEYTSTQSSNNLYINGIDIKAGEEFYVQAELESGESSDLLIYANSSSASSGGVRIREITYGNIFKIVAPIDMTRLVGYARGFDNAVITVTLTKNSRITNIENRLDELDNEFVSVPVYAENMVKNINTKLVNLQGSQTVTLGFITDIHVHGDTLEDATQNAMLTSMAALNAINRRNPLDLVILNGDYLYNDSSTTKETALEWYDRLSKTVAYLNPPLFIGKGNHDANDITKNLTQYLSDEEIYKVFAKLTTADYVGNYGYLEKSYGYYDIPNKKVRIIIIDTVDIPLIIEDESLKYSEQHTICISNEQLGFIADALKFVDSGWGVVFVSHHALQNGSGINPNESSDVYVPLNHGGSQLLGIINAYRNKTSYTDASGSGDFVYDVSVDYSDNESNEVIAMLSGHTHRDLDDVVNGILMVSTTAASFIYTAYYADGTVIQRTSQTESETSWDIVTIDRAVKKLYLTRYGAGTDRVFDY